MAVFVLSDTHLSFSDSVDKPMNVFGFKWNGHAEKIRSAWSDLVGRDDTVVIGGDISWAMSLDEALPDLNFLDGLNGNKILVRGNHDYWWSTLRKMESFRAEHRLDSINFLNNNAFNADDVTICGSRGWYYEKKGAPADTDYEKIVAREAGRLEMSLLAGEKISEGREIVAFLHFPPAFCDFVCPELISVLHAHGVKRCYYGHIHGLYDMPPESEYEGIRLIQTAADYLDFCPISVSKGIKI